MPVCGSVRTLDTAKPCVLVTALNVPVKVSLFSHTPDASRRIPTAAYHVLTKLQGGWDPNVPEPQFPSNLRDEIAQAFANVEHNLKDAGGKGWTQVFRVNSYHTELTPEVSALMTEHFRKYIGTTHQPIWTEIGVRQLGAPGMNVEIEVVAYDP